MVLAENVLKLLLGIDVANPLLTDDLATLTTRHLLEDNSEADYSNNIDIRLAETMSERRTFVSS